MSVELTLPESPANEAAGMFMVHVDLLDGKQQSVRSSSRPARLRYRSWLIDMLSDVLFAAPLVFGWMDEAQTMRIVMLENIFDERVRDPHTTTHICIVWCLRLNFFSRVCVNVLCRADEFSLQRWDCRLEEVGLKCTVRGCGLTRGSRDCVT